MSHFSLRAIGLTETEAQALIDVADSRMGELEGLASSYDVKSEERTLERLKKAAGEGKIADEQVGELLAVRNLHGTKAAAFVGSAFEPKFNYDFGYFTEHESFGCMSHHMPSSTHPSFVGTPTLDSTCVNLGFHRAEFGFTRLSEKEARLNSTYQLTEIDLSADQFAGLMRDRESGSPCAIGRDGGTLLDQPPRMISSISIAMKAKTEAQEIVKPLMAAAKALMTYVGSAEKISTKADYAELERLAGNVQEAMDLVRPPLRELLAMTAGVMAESSTKQLLAEISEPLKRLGMSEGEVLSLMKF